MNKNLEDNACVFTVSVTPCSVNNRCLCERAADKPECPRINGEVLNTAPCLCGAAECSIPRVKGMALATCCHHLCTWKDYVNREFFTQGGFTEKDFNTLLRMTSWATSGFGKARSIAYKMNVLRCCRDLALAKNSQTFDNVYVATKI